MDVAMTRQRRAMRRAVEPPQPDVPRTHEESTDMATKNPGSGTSKRGFASMDEERQREIASEGGRAAHASGNAHQFTSEEARRAGQKGGEAVSSNREHMAAIGRKGGEASHGRRSSNEEEGGRGGNAQIAKSARQGERNEEDD
jgi:general stress protein YciG